MGTRSLTKIKNAKDDEFFVTFYKQYDGYPDGYGQELADFLAPFNIVNGYNSGDTRKIANGMHCLAAQICSHFKEEVGGYYLYSGDANDMWEEYVYEIYEDNGKVIMVCNEINFEGSPSEFKDYVENSKYLEDKERDLELSYENNFEDEED